MTASLLSHRVAVSPGAMNAKPLSAEEIDAHPDADRIWATILRMRMDHSEGRYQDFPSGRNPGLD